MQDTLLGEPVASTGHLDDRRQDGSNSFRFQTVRTSRMTFEAEKIRQWVLNQIPDSDGVTILNACAGETRLDTDIDGTVLRNDINTDLEADLHVDIAEIANHVEPDSVDVVIHDPPYNETQSDGTYGTGEQTRYGEATMSQFRSVLKSGGLLIQWGYSPQLNDKFDIEQVAVWNRVGRGFDFIATVQRYRPSLDSSATSLKETTTVPFNPRIDGVTGDANFGGNDGRPVEMNLKIITDDLDLTVLEAIDELRDGLTLIITDMWRNYQQLKNRTTAIISLVDARVADTAPQYLSVDTHLGTRTLSDALPNGVFDSIVLDLQRDAYCWNTYYQPDTPWEEMTEQTGYVKALKTEANKLLTPDAGQIIQVAQTTTNMPAAFGFYRSHVVLTAGGDQLTTPIITADQRLPETIADSINDRAHGDHDWFWPGRVHTNERCPLSSPEYTAGREGMHRHPAYLAFCPECGADIMNLCIEGGTIVPHGRVHEERAEEGIEKFCSEGLTLPLREYVSTCISGTDPARPATAGGVNKTPPADQDDNTDSRPTATLTDFSSSTPN